MSDTNAYIPQMAAVFTSPFTFTTTTGAADAIAALTIVRANLDLVIAELSLEGTDGNHRRFYFDEMSNPARVLLVKALTDLKTASPNP